MRGANAQEANGVNEIQLHSSHFHKLFLSAYFMPPCYSPAGPREGRRAPSFPWLTRPQASTYPLGFGARRPKPVVGGCILPVGPWQKGCGVSLPASKESLLLPQGRGPGRAAGGPLQTWAQQSSTTRGGRGDTRALWVPGGNALGLKPALTPTSGLLRGPSQAGGGGGGGGRGA